MKANFIIIIFVTIFLASCAPVTTAPVSTETAVSIPTSTFTPQPTATFTAIPSKTPMPELLPAEVDLPLEKDISELIYKHCYVFADDNKDGQLDRFHAGDLIYFYVNSSSADNKIEYTVLAPIEGKVAFSQLITDDIGWEIRIQTPYLVDGKQVWYDIVHANKPAAGIKEGVYVEKGQPILIVSTLRNNGRFEKAIDIAFRNDTRGPNPDIKGKFYPYSYFDPSVYFNDDFEQLKSAGVKIAFETCNGDAVSSGFPMKP